MLDGKIPSGPIHGSRSSAYLDGDFQSLQLIQLQLQPQISAVDVHQLVTEPLQIL